jgi:TRAP-type C4-dicarboxylate transport system substrate-binding protein
MKRISVLAATAGLLWGVQAQAQTVLTVSSWVPPKHLISLAQAEWCDELAKKTSNRVRCNILPKAPMPAPGTMDGIKKGLVDVSFAVHGYTPGRFVLTQMAEVPFLGESATTISVAFNKIASKYPGFGAEHDKQGVKVLTYFTHGPGMILNTKKDIRSVSDLNGLKFRIGGGMINEITKRLDMNVTLKPAPASYELISTGVMDGTLFPAESMLGFKINTLIKHITTVPGGLYNTSFVFAMNPDKYNSLSAQDKKAVDELSGEFAARLFGRYWDKYDALAMEDAKKRKMSILKASPAMIQDITIRIGKLERDWAAQAEKAGLPNASAVLAEFRNEIAKVK